MSWVTHSCLIYPSIRILILYQHTHHTHQWKCLQWDLYSLHTLTTNYCLKLLSDVCTRRTSLPFKTNIQVKARIKVFCATCISKRIKWWDIQAISGADPVAAAQRRPSCPALGPAPSLSAPRGHRDSAALPPPWGRPGAGGTDALPRPPLEAPFPGRALRHPEHVLAEGAGRRPRSAPQEAERVPPQPRARGSAPSPLVPRRKAAGPRLGPAPGPAAHPPAAAPFPAPAARQPRDSSARPRRFRRSRAVGGKPRPPSRSRRPLAAGSPGAARRRKRDGPGRQGAGRERAVRSGPSRPAGTAAAPLRAASHDGLPRGLSPAVTGTRGRGTAGVANARSRLARFGPLRNRKGEISGWSGPLISVMLWPKVLIQRMEVPAVCGSVALMSLCSRWTLK